MLEITSYPLDGYITPVTKRIESQHLYFDANFQILSGHKYKLNVHANFHVNFHANLNVIFNANSHVNLRANFHVNCYTSSI